MKFKDNLKKIMLEKQISQKKLSELTGLQTTAISHFETGRRRPNMENIIKLTKALQVTSDRLLGIKISEKSLTPNKDLAKSCGTCKVHNSLSRNKRCFDWPECGLTYDKWKPMNIAKS